MEETAMIFILLIIGMERKQKRSIQQTKHFITTNQWLTRRFLLFVFLFHLEILFLSLSLFLPDFLFHLQSVFFRFFFCCWRSPELLFVLDSLVAVFFAFFVAFPAERLAFFRSPAATSSSLVTLIVSNWSSSSSSSSDEYPPISNGGSKTQTFSLFSSLFSLSGFYREFSMWADEQVHRLRPIWRWFPLFRLTKSEDWMWRSNRSEVERRGDEWWRCSSPSLLNPFCSMIKRRSVDQEWFSHQRNLWSSNEPNCVDFLLLPSRGQPRNSLIIAWNRSPSWSLTLWRRKIFCNAERSSPFSSSSAAFLLLFAFFSASRTGHWNCFFVEDKSKPMSFSSRTICSRIEWKWEKENEANDCSSSWATNYPHIFFFFFFFSFQSSMTHRTVLDPPDRDPSTFDRIRWWTRSFSIESIWICHFNVNDHHRVEHFFG